MVLPVRAFCKVCFCTCLTSKIADCCGYWGGMFRYLFRTACAWHKDAWLFWLEDSNVVMCEVLGMPLTSIDHVYNYILLCWLWLEESRLWWLQCLNRSDCRHLSWTWESLKITQVCTSTIISWSVWDNSDQFLHIMFWLSQFGMQFQSLSVQFLAAPQGRWSSSGVLFTPFSLNPLGDSVQAKTSQRLPFAKRIEEKSEVCLRNLEQVFNSSVLLQALNVLWQFITIKPQCILSSYDLSHLSST